jgi:PAS domain S-box-containing protein
VSRRSASPGERPGRRRGRAGAGATRILIVEDDESVACTLGAVLQAEGYAVELAAGVPEALAQLERARFDAALLDLRVGGADGLTVLPRLRERWPGAVGIVLTGFGSVEAAVQAVRAGADDFLLKPSDVAELKASIARAIHWRAQMDRRRAALERANERLVAELAKRRQREDSLRHSEAQLALAQALAHLGIWEWDLRDNLVVWSDELYRIYGFRPHECDATYEAFLERVHADDREFVRGAIETARRAGAPFEFDHRIVRPDGTVRILHARGEAVTDETGRTVRLFGTAQDTTERTEAEARVGVLEDLNRLKEEFIATASHDLKGPLTSIRGYTQLLLRHTRGAAPDLERVVNGLAVIEAQTGAMTRLLDRLLDASRIQAGVLDVRTQPCELGECLDAVLARLSPPERERVDVALPDAPLAGEWDQTRIEQVLANLIGNALKYSPGTERVRVAVERRAREVEVAVTDRGMGIPPEELPRLFERFHRTPQALASGLPGTGLGLYICWGVVVAHGGRIWAESPGVGHGTAFRFTLPSPALPPEPSAAGHR